MVMTRRDQRRDHVMSVEKLVILLPIAPSRRLEKRKKGGRTRLKIMIRRSLTRRSIKVKLTLAMNGIRMMIVPTQVIVMKRRPTLLFKQVLHLHQDSSPTLWTMTTTLLLALWQRRRYNPTPLLQPLVMIMIVIVKPIHN